MIALQVRLYDLTTIHSSNSAQEQRYSLACCCWLNVVLCCVAMMLSIQGLSRSLKNEWIFNGKRRDCASVSEFYHMTLLCHLLFDRLWKPHLQQSRCPEGSWVFKQMNKNSHGTLKRRSYNASYSDLWRNMKPSVIKYLSAPHICSTPQVSWKH